MHQKKYKINMNYKQLKQEEKVAGVIASVNKALKYKF